MAGVLAVVVVVVIISITRQHYSARVLLSVTAIGKRVESGKWKKKERNEQLHDEPFLSSAAEAAEAASCELKEEDKKRWKKDNYRVAHRCRNAVCLCI